MADYIQPIANGIRTDHPYPNLPFVDDAHIPLEDPVAIEKIGRVDGGTTWGRRDHDERTGEWWAYTTDPHNHAYAWIVCHHPHHGRSVLLYHDRDTPSAYQTWWGDRPVLARSGGYWWDGATWYRPAQVVDLAAEGYARRRVTHPTTQTAANLLDSTSRASWGREYKIAGFEPVTVDDQQWRNDLAYWATQQDLRTDTPGLDHCLVGLNAPELSQLLGFDEIAEVIGESASKLREDYEHDFPEKLPVPQAVVNGQPRWSRPVVQDWREERRRDRPEDILTGRSFGSSPAVHALWSKLDTSFSTDLPASHPEPSGIVQRFLSSLAAPSQSRNLAHELSWRAALHSQDMLPPLQPMLHVIEQAVLREFQTAPEPPGGVRELDLTPMTGHLLVWFVWHQPQYVPALFGHIVGAAERDDVLPRDIAINTLRSTILFEADQERFTEMTLKDYLDACLPPTSEG